MLRSTPRLLLLLFAMLALAPASALAQTTAPATIDGSPLNVFTDDVGRIQAELDGAPSEFFPSGSADSPSTTGNAGFNVIIDPGASTERDYGPFVGGSGTLVSGPTVTPGNPATITTQWTFDDSSGNPALRVTQVLSYTNGSRQFDSTYTVDNISGQNVSFRALVAGDLSIRGSDRGVGFVSGDAPNRFMGGLNQSVGAAGGFVEQTPWSAFETNTLSAVHVGANNTSSNPGFDNSVSTTDADNAAGVEWDNFYPPNALGPRQSATFQVGWRFVDTLGVSPLNAIEQTGNEHVMNVTLADVNGNPAANQPIAFTVTGANQTTGTTTTDAAGHAQISYIGGNPGLDVVDVFNDQNHNGQPDSGEPHATANVLWEGPPPPIAGQSVNVHVESGTVKVQVPRGTPAPKLAKMGLPAAARSKFVPVTANIQIPVKSIIDTHRGTIRLLSAGRVTSAGAAFNGGSFNGGRFQVLQKANNPLTELVSQGDLGRCNTRVPRGGAKGKIAVEARRRSRRLLGNAHGHFRTRGRNSSATVRGTQWVEKDTCTSTTTTVKQGSVTVHDFSKNRNVVVRAGKKYVARSPRKVGR